MENMELSENMRDRIGKYVEIVRNLAPKVDEAYGVAILQEIGKDLRCDRVVEKRHAENGSESQPATQKQIDYLKRLGIEITEKVTKKKASQLIDEARKRESASQSVLPVSAEFINEAPIEVA